MQPNPGGSSRLDADIAQRLLWAVPRAEAWIDDLLKRHRRDSVQVSDAGFTRLADYFPAALLETARVATVETLPALPVADYGLPEFEAMANAPASAITFRDIFFIRPHHASDSIYFHELVHVVQWRALGVHDFLLTYALGLLRHGYAESPLEAIAFELQGHFDRRTPIENVSALVERHAADARATAAAMFTNRGAG